MSMRSPLPKAKIGNAFNQGLKGPEVPDTKDPFDPRWLGRRATITQNELWPKIQERAARVAMIGGKGSAKTTTFAAALVERCQKYPSSKWFISAASYQQAIDTCAREIVKISNMMNLNMVYKDTMIIDNLKHRFVYYFPDFYSVICIRSGDAIDMIEGSEWDGGHIGEVQLWKADDVKTAFARIRRGVGDHCRFIDGLPQDEDHWQYGFIESNNFILREISTYENEANLPPEYIPDLLSMYPGSEGKRYVMGERVSLHKMPTNPAYQPEIHRTSKIAKRLTNYDPYKKLFISFDFNVAPCCASVWQVKPNRFKVIRKKSEDSDIYEEKIVYKDIIAQVDEFEAWRGATRTLCDMIMDVYGDHDAGGIVCGDASGNSEDTRSVGVTDWTIIADTIGTLPGMVIKKGLVINRRKKDRSVGRRKGKLKKYSNPPLKETIQNLNRVLLDGDGHPGMVFMPKSKYESGGVAASVSATKYKADGSIDETVDREDGREIKRTHFWATTRYVAWLLSPPGSSSVRGSRSDSNSNNDWEPEEDRIF